MIFLNIPDSSGSEPDITPEDEALESFLSRDNTPQKPQKPKKSRAPLILILAILVVAGLVALILFLNANPAEQPSGEPDGGGVNLSVNADNEHTVAVPTGSDGSPVQNGSGELICYDSADVLSVSVTNASGSFTLTCETSDDGTAYNLVGFEGYPLRDSAAESLAGDAAELPFTTIVSVGGDPADFGLDPPRATVKATYADGTSAVILVGDEAPASAGVYISLGDASSVFLAADDDVDSFLYAVTELISLSVTETAEEDDNNEFTRLTISGTNFDDPIVIEPTGNGSDDESETAYRVTSPKEFGADPTEGADIASSVRGLTADAVAAVLPVDGNPFDLLKTYGLDTPYAEIVAEYPDTTIRLRASAPDDEGRVYLMNLTDEVTGERIVYEMQYGSLRWASTSLEALQAP
jgi:hypothetical protein